MKLAALLALLPFVHATETIPSSCRDLEDGVYWLKFLDGEDYPAVETQCSNGFAILDFSRDNNVQEYFDTWSMWHFETAGPTNDVHPNWEDWFLGNDGDSKYVVSPDCSSCEAEHARQLFGEATSYWMTGTLFGCFWAIKGAHNCDIDWDSGTCYTCMGDTMQDQGKLRVELDDDASINQYDQSGICPHNIRASNHYTPSTHDQCTHEETAVGKTMDNEDTLHLKPSIGTNGEYCVCVQQSSTSYFEIDEIPEGPKLPKEEEEDVYQYVKLYQSHFDEGTLRITKSGTYTIMEDIIFDFSSNEIDPNADGAYLPDESQSDHYPGAGDYRDPFFMGFFAGITVECDDVVIDLNGHTLQMSDYFYYQQRWFTTIELATQYFLPGQGIGNFGAQPTTASNILIKDGTLGLTSHHGIHGNYNNDILISNVIIKDFETHGIQFNGFDNVILQDVEIGPTSSKAFFNGEYGHMRLMLPRYKKIAEESPDETIKFYGRDIEYTMLDICDEIELQMNYAFNYVVNGDTIKENDDNYESFESALNLFVNADGIPNGGAQYGIFLNTFGASVFTYNLYTGFYSTKATLNNVKIHGMEHDMDEYVRLHIYATGDIIINPFNAPLSLDSMFEDVNDLSEPRYKGNVILDAAIASNKFSNNWGYLQLQIVLNDYIVPWATGEDLTSLGENIQIGCNSDVMIHSGKGINGLRLDGVSAVNINGLEIYDLHDYTPVGKDTCGEYDDFCALCGTTGGHFRQTQPMQIGFTGNMNQGINVNAAIDVTMEDVLIYDLTSNTGPAFGISIWPANEVTFKGKIEVHDISAGVGLDSGTYSYTDRPNKAPETCAVRIYWKYSNYVTQVDYEQANIITSCLSGHVGCRGSSQQATMIGGYEGCSTNDGDDQFPIKEAGIGDANPTQSGNKFDPIHHGDTSDTDDAEDDAEDDEQTTFMKANSSSISYAPKQSFTNITIELVLLGLLIYAGYYFYSKKQSQSQKLISTDFSEYDYGTENVAY